MDHHTFPYFYVYLPILQVLKFKGKIVICGNNARVYRKNSCFIGNCKIQNNKYRGIDRTREMVRMRDNQTCQECKKVWIEGNRKYDVHHLNGLCGKRSRKYDKVSEMDGLITLCHKCHYNRFDHSMKSYKQV